MSIGPLRFSATLSALALAVGIAGCGSSLPKTQTLPATGAPPSGRVPANVSVLTVTRGYPGRRPSLALTTTALGKIAAIATMLDRLHPARPGIVNCPMIRPAPTVTFAFRAHRGGPVLARASTLASGPRGECPPVMFTAAGRARQGLSAQPVFLRQAQRVLGVTLVSK